MHTRNFSFNFVYFFFTSFNIDDGIRNKLYGLVEVVHLYLKFVLEYKWPHVTIILPTVNVIRDIANAKNKCRIYLY